MSCFDPASKVRRKWNTSICRTSYLYVCNCTFVLSVVVLTYFCFLLSEQHQRLGFGYDNEADQSDDSVCTLAFPAFSEDLPNNSTQHCDSNE